MSKKTSELIHLQNETDAELRLRFSSIFESHKALAFSERNDPLFVEMWTPSSAAAPYRFDRYEISSDQVRLYGIWSAECFLYTLSLSFPTSLIDDDQAIGEFLREQYAKRKEKAEQEATTSEQTK